MSEQAKPLKAKTAFIIIQAESGNYYALNTLDTQIEVEAPATLHDMKIGCQEIRDAIYRNDIVDSVKAALTPKAEETVSSSIRGALEERDIL